MKVKRLILCFLFVCLICLFACQMKYKVRFYIDDNESTYQIINKGECIEFEDPTKEGYTFLGWYYKDELFDVNTKITKNMSLYAKWSPNDCKISFYIDEENIIVVDYVYDNIVKEIEKPKKKDYIFLGWYLEGELYDFSLPIKKDITLEALWVKDSEYTPELTISFNSTGAHVDIDSIVVNRLDEYKNLPIVSRDGYEFLGWFVDDKKVVDGDVIVEIEDFTLIAKWQEK